MLDVGRGRKQEHASDGFGPLLRRFADCGAFATALYPDRADLLALVQGRAIGAGADLAAAAMKVVAAPAARFQMPGPRFGVVLGTRRLAYRVDNVRARQIQIENRPVEAAEALAIGLVDDLVDPEGWAETTANFGQAYGLLEPGTVAALADVTRPDTRDADMAALARSVAVPGLKDRIAAFRAGAVR